jgi:hypothetical protein
MALADNGSAAEPGCPNGCPAGECYCAEPCYADVTGVCQGYGGIDECYCGEGDDGEPYFPDGDPREKGWIGSRVPARDRGD